MVTNPIVPALFLNKIHNYICYHRVRESQSSREFRLIWIPVEYNLADLLTKTTMTIKMIHGLVELIFFNKAAVIREKDKN